MQVFRPEELATWLCTGVATHHTQHSIKLWPHRVTDNIWESRLSPVRTLRRDSCRPLTRQVVSHIAGPHQGTARPGIPQDMRGKGVGMLVPGSRIHLTALHPQQHETNQLSDETVDPRLATPTQGLHTRGRLQSLKCRTRLMRRRG